MLRTSASPAPRRRAPLDAPDEPGAPPLRVLLVTARMGAGHTGVADELRRRLAEEGAIVETADFLDWLPAGLGEAMEAIYRVQLRHAPWTYDLLYRLRFRYASAWGGVNAFYTRLTRHAALDRIAAFAPDAVVSLYPLAATILARLRRQGLLDAATVTFVTDLGVHPLWVHPGADLHLCVHDHAAADAERRTGVPSTSRGPVVRRGFRPSSAARARGRARLGKTTDDRVVLVSGGSWGVGDLAGTVRTISRSARFAPVVLCGRDDALRRRIRAAGGMALGWTDDMADVLAAADALVDNAGGLTCMEAFAMGVPVVSYRPIAGHGRHNAAEMARAGIARYPRSPQGLLEVLERVTADGAARDDVVGAAAAMFVGDAAKDVLDAARQGRAGREPRAERGRHAGRHSRSALR